MDNNYIYGNWQEMDVCMCMHVCIYLYSTNPGGVVEFTKVDLVAFLCCHRTGAFPLRRAQLNVTVLPCTALTVAGCSANLSS